MAKYTPWQSPDPQAIVGMNSVMVYGENIQVAAGLNHQIALGSNLQLCINPAVLVELLGAPGSEVFSQLCGSGLGGNMQFTIGSSANVVWGRQFTINLGPEEFKMDNDHERPLSKLLCSLIGVAAIAHAIAYGIISDEDQKATEVIIFQGLIDLLLATFMMAQMVFNKVDQSITKATKALVTFPLWDPKTELERWEVMLELATILGALVTVPVIISTEEGHFQGETQDSSN
jgi:hypothetical protein